MALVWLAVVTLLPPLVADERLSRPSKRWLETLLRCNLAAVDRHGKAIILAAVVIASASIVSVGRLRFETNPLAYFPPDSRIVHDFATIDARLTGTLPFQVTVTGSADPTEMLRSTPGVRKIISVSVVVPGSAATYWGLADGDALPHLIAAQSAWQAWAGENQVQLQWRGVAAQIHATGRILLRVAVITLPAMGLIAALAVGSVTRSFRMAVVGALINLLPVCGLILIAAAARLSLGLPALMIGAIAVGMSIDDTIHLVRAFKRRGSTTRGLIRCWRPCVGSTLVAASCMALFAISPFRPTQQFGTLLAATALVALVTDMLLLPVLCSRRRASRLRGSEGCGTCESPP
ncbi:MAG: hypothetical protein IID33_07375 [Planctomycetes bacterium]|nr:hypothetical protein [Planctomycetota bacterium]